VGKKEKLLWWDRYKELILREKGVRPGIGSMERARLYRFSPLFRLHLKMEANSVLEMSWVLQTDTTNIVQTLSVECDHAVIVERTN
jgi:hypothetical protein